MKEFRTQRAKKGNLKISNRLVGFINISQHTAGSVSRSIFIRCKSFFSAMIIKGVQSLTEFKPYYLYLRISQYFGKTARQVFYQSDNYLLWFKQFWTTCRRGCEEPLGEYNIKISNDCTWHITEKINRLINGMFINKKHQTQKNSCCRNVAVTA